MKWGLRGINAKAPKPFLQGRCAWLLRQCVGAAALAAAAAGCSDSAPPIGTVGHVRSYFGGLAADEPQAALIGRDILSAGGSAADAVVAMSMVMMVTRPDAAGPGGGGMCVVFDRETKKAEALEFLPHASRTPPSGGQWIAAVPGSFRGLFALHARYGKVRWEQVVQPAERLARFGVRVPRALGRALARDGAALKPEGIGRTVFFDPAGRLLREGDTLRQVNLAITLGRVRSTGPGDFYSGHLGRRFIEEVERLGGWLTPDDLRNYRPTWQETVKGAFGPHDVHFLPSPALGGRVAAAIWSDLGDDGAYADAEAGQKAVLLTSAAQRAHAAALAGTRTTAATAGVLAMDRTGNAAACVLTMNRPFGIGRIAGETGIIPTAPADGGATLAMSAMIVANRHVPQSFLAATGAGDPAAPVALMNVALSVLKGGEIEAAVAAPRVAPSGSPESVEVEAAAAPAVREALRRAGIAVKDVPTLGVVNMMYCPNGIVREPRTCTVRADTRGSGYAVNAEF
jgi:gamma-glutamyltranspeptidase/glutathione hydrolase